LDSGCSVLLSEDMHHGLNVEGRLEIRNPFI
jgi:predicted nucleic acid-binding protein